MNLPGVAEGKSVAEREGSTPYRSLAVIGAGAWGTALAIVAARAGREVLLWCRDPELANAIAAERRNPRYLPDHELPGAVRPTGEIERACEAEAILLVTPAQRVRETAARAKRHLRAETPIVICAKGVERGSGRLMSEVAAEVLPGIPVGVLSGPSFAQDVAAGLPTAVTIAAAPNAANRLQASFGHNTFRPYASDDVLGVALGGAAKNVYAIACGIVEGMGLGESARAALLARSFAELRRLGEKMGARADTLMGLSGLGDLVLTATSTTSRNFAFGVAVGKGSHVADLLQAGHPLAEGVATAPALVARAQRHEVELPIAGTTAAVLDGKLAVAAALPLLMNRPLKPE